MQPDFFLKLQCLPLLAITKSVHSQKITVITETISIMFMYTKGPKRGVTVYQRKMIQGQKMGGSNYLFS